MIYFLLPSALGERSKCMCVCVCWLLSVYSSDPPPTDHEVITWRAPPTSVASQQWGALVLACVPVAVVVCSCLFSQGGVHVSRCLAGVRSLILHNAPGSLFPHCPHSLQQTGVK